MCIDIRWRCPLCLEARCGPIESWRCTDSSRCPVVEPPLVIDGRFLPPMLWRNVHCNQCGRSVDDEESPIDPEDWEMEAESVRTHIRQYCYIRDVNANWGLAVAKNWPPRARARDIVPTPPEYTPPPRRRRGTPGDGAETGGTEGNDVGSNDSGIVTGSEDPINDDAAADDQAEETVSEEEEVEEEDADAYTEEYTEETESDVDVDVDMELPSEDEFRPSSATSRGKNKNSTTKLGNYVIKRAPTTTADRHHHHRRRGPYSRSTSTTAPRPRVRNPNSTRLRTRGRIAWEDIPPHLQDKIISLQEEITERKGYIKRHGGSSAAHARPVAVAPGPSSWRVDRFGQLKIITNLSDWLICEDQLLYALRQELSDEGLGPMPHEQVRDEYFSERIIPEAGDERESGFSDQALKKAKNNLERRVTNLIRSEARGQGKRWPYPEDVDDEHPPGWRDAKGVAV